MHSQFAGYAWAEPARVRLIGQLRRHNVPGATAVAAVLEACTDTHPCRSAACPLCGLAFQGAAVSIVDRFIRIPARAIRSRMHALTIVPASGCLTPNHLTAWPWKGEGSGLDPPCVPQPPSRSLTREEVIK